MMVTAGWLLFSVPFLLTFYAYLGYPLLLRTRTERDAKKADEVQEWPRISISLPVYNEVAQIREVLDSLLKLDYPRDRLQIVVISDASSDGTDDIVREYADRGITLIRQPNRLGKTAGENAAAPHLTGDIVINTDASIRIRADAIKPLVAQFLDPSVGVASGRDVSVAAVAANAAEGGYVGYEMWVRHLETNAGGIIGASGCFYAIRTPLHRVPMPDSLSRDFGAALIAKEHGFRAVSVDEAVCLVPRTKSLEHEYRRKVRTITRGMETLAFKKHLLNPFSAGGFAWKLWSHKVARWLVPWAALAGLIGLILLATEYTWATWLLGLAVGGCALLAVGQMLPKNNLLRRLSNLVVFAIAGNAAVVHASLLALRGDRTPTWEPTRRDPVAH